MDNPERFVLRYDMNTSADGEQAEVDRKSVV